jgi:hypothetical protein
MKKSGVWKTVATMYVCLLSAQVYGLPAPEPVRKPEIAGKLARVQVPFVENKGQINNSEISFYARTLSGTLFVENSGVLTYALPLNDKAGVVFKEIITGKKMKPSGLTPSSIVIHSFKGRDRSTWKTSIPNYEAVSLGEIYENVDLTLRAYGNNVEKIFTVFPGGNPAHIAIKLQGIKRLQTNAKGELEAITPLGSVSFSKPLAYQMADGKKQFVEAAYAVRKGTGYGFKLGSYDKTRPLIIDPLLASTIIGTSSWEFSWTVGIDGNNNIFVSSNTKSPSFPTTPGAYDETFNGGSFDIYVSKFDGTLSTLLASTFIGGAGDEQVYRLTLDDEGNVLCTGKTTSTDFPVTPGAYTPPSRGTYDVFVARLDNSLSTLSACTVIGGSDDDQGYDIMLDGSENVIVTGFTASADYPSTAGAYDESHNGGQDVFVAKFDNTLSSLLASTFIGGGGSDSATGITLDGEGNILLTGVASSTFPTTPGAYDRTFNGGSADAFVARINSSLSTLMASTLIGGSNVGYGYSVKVNGGGEIYMAGETFSSDYPTTPGAYDPTWNGGSMDVMISKFDSTLSTLLASTYLGGSDQDWHHHALLIDGEGNIYVNGLTKSDDFPTTPDAEKRNNAFDFDVFISKFNSTLSTILYSTLFGGNVNGNGSLEMLFDADYNIYITGWTTSSDFPTTPGAYDESYNGDMDVYVAKICIYGTPDNADCDSIPDDEDICPTTYNPGQEDTYPPGGNGCGNACECEGNFDEDLDQDGTDAAVFKVDFGRSKISGNPCTNLLPCNGDFDCDVDVDGTNASQFKSDFGRSKISGNPCPICPTNPWCLYP